MNEKKITMNGSFVNKKACGGICKKKKKAQS